MRKYDDTITIYVNDGGGLGWGTSYSSSCATTFAAAGRLVEAIQRAV